MVFAVLMFGILPIKISFYITPKNFDLFLKRIVIGLIKCLLIYLFLLILKFIPTFSQYYKFNSAIDSYQQSNNQINFLTYLSYTDIRTIQTKYSKTTLNKEKSETEIQLH